MAAILVEREEDYMLIVGVIMVGIIYNQIVCLQSLQMMQTAPRYVHPNRVETFKFVDARSECCVITWLRDIPIYQKNLMV